MPTLKDLIAQRDALDAKIAELRKTELADAISKTRTLIAEFGLTESDVFGGVRKEKKAKVAGSKVAAKYRDPVSGKEWSGRGLAPKWMQGKEKTEFLIVQ